MSYTPNPSDKNWHQVVAYLDAMFDTWRVKVWEIHCPMAEGKATKGYVWARMSGEPHEAQVTIRFQHPKDGERSVTVSRFAYPQDNLWAIWKGLDSIRLNELRGIDDVERQFYGALPAPKVRRDPWQVLGLSPSADPDVIRSVYRTLANKRHPDKGGSAEAMAELTEAYEAALAAVR